VPDPGMRVTYKIPSIDSSFPSMCGTAVSSRTQRPLFLPR